MGFLGHPRNLPDGGRRVSVGVGRVVDGFLPFFGGIRKFVFGSVSFFTVSPSPQAGR
jgi:hypothetical protein